LRRASGGSEGLSWRAVSRMRLRSGLPATQACRYTGLLSILPATSSGVIATRSAHQKPGQRLHDACRNLLGVIVIMAECLTRSMFYGGTGQRRSSSSSSSKDGTRLQLVFFWLRYSCDTRAAACEHALFRMLKERDILPTHLRPSSRDI